MGKQKLEDNSRRSKDVIVRWYVLSETYERLEWTWKGDGDLEFIMKAMSSH